MSMDEVSSLKQKIHQLECELAEQKQRTSELERAKPGSGSDVGELPIAVNEFEETLRRLVQRTAMIVQAEKCVIMVRDRESGDFFARSPAFGMNEEEVAKFRVPMQEGISGEVFRSGNPTIFHDAEHNTLALQENLPNLRVRNGVTVPLIVEKRDDDSRVIDRLTIGVLHCFNKRYSGEFIDEDVRLLERLSRNAAAVIANAQMFQEVVEEKQKLVHTLESITAGLILINQHGRIGQMNAQARTMFEVGEEALGKPMEEVLKHEECLAIINRKISEAAKLTDDEVVETETDDLPKTPDEVSIFDSEAEEYIYQVHAAAVRDDSEKPIGTVVIFNDITDIRNVERMKTEFVSIVSHELRTPLTPMKGFVRTLLDDENEEWYTLEDRREFYTIIDSNVDRLSRLINDLLNVSRIEKTGVEGIEMNWEDVDIRKSAEAVLDIQKGMTDQHTFVIDFEPESIIAETDPDKIQNILQNLVSNAIKYSPAGGEVRIIGRIENDTESLLIGIKDQGMGIPETAQKKLFTKFYRVDNKSTRKVGGTGIGLFLVKNLVDAHKGQIWVESEAGQGTTFWFRIPLHHPKAPGSESESESSEVD